MLSKEVYGAVTDAEPITFFHSVEVQVDTVALDGAAAILCHSDAVDISAVIGNNVHPGSVGNDPGVGTGCLWRSTCCSRDPDCCKPWL